MAKAIRYITEVVVEIREYTVPATQDLKTLKRGKQAVTSRVRKLIVDRKVQVRINSSVPIRGR